MPKMAQLEQVPLRPAFQPGYAGQGGWAAVSGGHQQEILPVHHRLLPSDQDDVIGTEEGRGFENGKHAALVAKSFGIAVSVEEQTSA
jgi:hypothetical protein